MNFTSVQSKIYTEHRVLLHLGCGPDTQRTRWTDVDGSWNLRVQTSWWGLFFSQYAASLSGYKWPAHVRWMDITKGLPFADGSVDAIYASHVLEHLYRSDALRLMVECKRILKSDGVIRLVLPDLKTIASSYLRDHRSDAAMRFNQSLLMREEISPRGLIGRLKALFADHHSHKFMYDVPLLVKDLKDAGYREVSETSYLDSRIPEISDVERAGRVLDGAGIIVEALK